VRTFLRLSNAASDWHVALKRQVQKGRIAAVHPAGSETQGIPGVDLAGRLVWPGFVDMHMHLDKGHVIPRIRPDGTLHGGFALTVQDWPIWTPEDMALVSAWQPSAPSQPR